MVRIALLGVTGRMGRQLLDLVNKAEDLELVGASSAEDDLHWTKRKVAVGAGFLISQLFFDNRYYFDFVDRAAAAGIETPLVPGIMPITNVAQIKRFTKMCGATIPAELDARLRRHEDDLSPRNPGPLRRAHVQLWRSWPRPMSVGLLKPHHAPSWRAPAYSDSRPSWRALSLFLRWRLSRMWRPSRPRQRRPWNRYPRSLYPTSRSESDRNRAYRLPLSVR